MPLSDHALLLFSALLNKKNLIKCLSWNVMAHKVLCNDVGVDDNQLDQQHGQNAYRYAQVSKFLAQKAKIHEPHIIALQEVTHDAIRPYLERHFPQDHWLYLEPNPAPSVGLVSLVAKKHFSLLSHEYDPNYRTQSFALRAKAYEANIHIHNVWTPYSFTPSVHETYYKTLLTQTMPSMLVGDTNSRVLPKQGCSKPEQLIATGVIPPIFKSCYKRVLDDDVILDHSDGAFIAIDGVIWQLPYEQLLSVEELTNNSSYISKQHNNYYRPFLTLDPDYQNLKTKSPYAEFFSLIQRFNMSQKEMILQPLLAANPEGIIGVGLGCSSQYKLYDEMQKALHLPQEGIYYWGGQQTLEKDKSWCFLTINPECIPAVVNYLNKRFFPKSVSVASYSLFCSGSPKLEPHDIQPDVSRNVNLG